MPERLSCCVPFCRRTRHNKEGFSEWICAEHWRAVPKPLRAKKTRFNKMYSRRYGNNPFWSYKGGSPERLGAVKIARICDHLWKKCKKAAIETAGGI